MENIIFTIKRNLKMRQTENQNPALKEINRHMSPLAEAVILQASADLWNKLYRKESIEFFQGKDFSMYACIAGMSSYEKRFFLGLMKIHLT